MNSTLLVFIVQIVFVLKSFRNHSYNIFTIDVPLWGKVREDSLELYYIVSVSQFVSRMSDMIKWIQMWIEYGIMRQGAVF